VITGLIAADPTVINITRHTKVPNAGGFSWNDVPVAAQTVRLYHFHTRNQREVMIPEGEVKTVVLGILAQPDADMVVGHASWDGFTVDGRTYRIVGVRDYDDANIPPCVEADCVAV